MNLVQRSTLIAAAGAAYLIGFWPTWALRDIVLGAFGNPAYEGEWILIPHVFLYSTLPALFSFAAWSILARLGWMPGFRVSLRLGTFGWGLGAGLVSIAVLVGFFLATGQASAFHAPQVVRNGVEEVVG